MEVLEKDIQREICEYLKKENFFFWRSNNIPVFGMNNGGNKTFRSMPKYTPKGIPDIIVIHHGNFIGLEVKRPKGKLRPDQIIFKENIEKAGGYYHEVHSVEEVDIIMSRYLPL